MATKTNTDDRLIAVLEGIVGELSLVRRAIEAHGTKADENLGFSEPPGFGITVDCATHDELGCLWAQYNGEGQQKTPLPARLKCRLIGADIVTIPTKKRGDSIKLCVKVAAGEQQYILTSGLETTSETHYYNNWTGSLLSALQNATDEQLRGVWSIIARKGKEDSVLFAGCYVDGTKVENIGEPSEGTHLAILDRVNSVLGYTARDKRNKPDEPPIAPSPAEFIGKVDCSQLWKDAEALGWTTATFGQLMVDYGFVDDKGKGTPRAITVDKLAMIRSMALDRAVLNEYSGVSFSASVEG